MNNTTFYLYARNKPVAEQVVGWSYYLSDGLSVPRQMSDAAGVITLEREYTPWGEVLKQAGTGNFTWGYFGGLMDAATGLLYVDGGQYYDPATGRFLTPANRGSGNPYLPGRVEPLGAVLAPVALAALFLRRKKKAGKWDTLIVAAALVLGMGAGLAACGGEGGTSTPTSSPPTLPPTGTCTPTVTPEPIETPQPPTPTSTPMTLFVFGGSAGEGISGASVPADHMSAWKGEYLPGYEVHYQQYNMYGKPETARRALVELPQKERVALICYSGGSEACLMYAGLRQQQGLKTEAIVALGGSYWSPTLDGSEVGFEYWGLRIADLAGNGTRVLLIDDNQKQTSIAIERAGSTPAAGSYEYHIVGIDHWTRYNASDGTYKRPGWYGIPNADEDDFIVDKSPTLRNAVLQWLETNVWILPEGWAPTQ